MLTKYKEIFLQKQARSSLFVSIAMMAAIGIIYIWSVFILPIEEEFGWPRNKISLVFTVTMVCLSSGIAFGGFIHRQVATKKLLAFVICAVTVAIITTSYSNNLSVMVFCYGAVCGSSMGIVYNLVVYTCNQWFDKDTAAIVSGLLQTCVAVSTVFLGYLAATLLEFYDWRTVIRIIGGLLVMSLLLCYKFFRQPYGEETVSHAVDENVRSFFAGIKPRQMIATKSFWFFCCIRLPILACGIGLLGHSIPFAIELGISPNNAILALGLFSFCNGLGRTVFGIIWNYAGVKKTVFIDISLFIISVAILSFSPLQQNRYTLLLAFALCGFSYGGVILMGVAFTRTVFGLKYFAENFGITSITMLVGSFIGPLLFGEIKLITGTYIDALLLFVTCSILSMFFLPWLKKSAY